MPESFTYTPVRLERIRLTLARLAVCVIWRTIKLVVRLMPKDHPTRIYLAARTDATKDIVIESLRNHKQASARISTLALTLIQLLL